MLREMTWLAQVHIAVKWQSHDLNQSVSDVHVLNCYAKRERENGAQI